MLCREATNVSSLVFSHGIEPTIYHTSGVSQFIGTDAWDNIFQYLIQSQMFEDTKKLIKSRKSTNDKQFNYPKKKKSAKKYGPQNITH